MSVLRVLLQRPAGAGPGPALVGNGEYGHLEVSRLDVSFDSGGEENFRAGDLGGSNGMCSLPAG